MGGLLLYCIVYIYLYGKGGDPLNPETTISCLINDNALGKVEAHVTDAKVGYLCFLDMFGGKYSES